MNFTQTVVLEQGGTGWQKIQSIFSAVRAWGVSVPVAYAVQASLLLSLAASMAWLWHSDAAFELKAAALAVGSLDWRRRMCSTTTSWCWQSRSPSSHDTASGRVFAITKSACWPPPGSCRCCRAALPASFTIPLGLIVMLAFYAFVLRRAALDRANITVGAPSIAQA